MFMRLLLAFTVVPLVELWLLLEVGRHLGVAPTIGLVLLTGVVGAALAKSQGFFVLSRLQERLAKGEMPADELIHGIFVLAGGILLLTPGLVTDLLGFFFLLPPSRAWCKAWLEKKLRAMLDRGEVIILRRH